MKAKVPRITTAVASPVERSQVPSPLHDRVVGYDVSLITRDLIKTAVLSGIIIASLIWLSFYLRWLRKLPYSNSLCNRNSLSF